MRIHQQINNWYTQDLKEIENKCNKIAAVDGYLSKEEAVILYILAKHYAKKQIIEVGSWKGKSTIMLTLGAKENPEKPITIAVDTFINDGMPEQGNTRTEFNFNIKRFGDTERLEVMEMTSEQASTKVSNESTEMIFIDATHTYDEVKKDYELWFPKLKTGGLIIFHDSVGNKTGYEGVYRAVKEITLDNPEVTECCAVETLNILMKGKAERPHMIANKLLFLEIEIQRLKRESEVLINDLRHYEN